MRHKVRIMSFRLSPRDVRATAPRSSALGAPGRLLKSASLLLMNIGCFEKPDFRFARKCGSASLRPTARYKKWKLPPASSIGPPVRAASGVVFRSRPTGISWSNQARRVQNRCRSQLSRSRSICNEGSLGVRLRILYTRQDHLSILLNLRAWIPAGLSQGFYLRGRVLVFGLGDTSVADKQCALSHRRFFSHHALASMSEPAEPISLARSSKMFHFSGARNGFGRI